MAKQKNVSVRQKEIFQIRLLNDDSIRWQCKERANLHLNNIDKNERGVEKNWKTSKTY
jgi:hypothetical protein